jgi:hypothetical protein
MRLRPSLIGMLAALAVTLSVFAATATAARPSATAGVTITPAQSGDVLNGVFEIANFTVNAAGDLVAEGVFTGTATIDGVVQQITSTASVVLAAATQATPGPCSILDLDLGPLHLDLLGLVIDLNEVHLDITGQPGAGKLLGNLLCTVTGLLDNGNAALTAIQQLLDLINSLLG